MDTTPKYILMCEKAREIQKGWKPEYDDCYIYKPTGNQGMVCLDNPLFEGDTEYHIWLPRQDQMLEKVLTIHKWTAVDLLWHFSEWATKATNAWANIVPFDSLEQLALQFCMHEVYNKVWNGKDWMEEKETT